MKKTLISIIIILAIAIGIFLIAFTKENQENQNTVTEISRAEKIADVRANERILPIPENIDESKAIYNVTNASYTIDITDNDVIGDLAQYIIIGTVEKIDGVTNYNPTTQNYGRARTVGTIQINTVLKGNIEEETIPFIRVGGVIPFSEYEKIEPEANRIKMGWDKMSQEEKESIYVYDMVGDDIFIQEGKTYLMYLSYIEDYERYAIHFAQYGLREVDITMTNNLNSINSNDYSNIKVRNNENGQFESLDSILPKEKTK